MDDDTKLDIFCTNYILENYPNSISSEDAFKIFSDELMERGISNED